MLASAPARELEERLRETGHERVAARGRLCWVGLGGTEEALTEDLPRTLEAVPAACWRSCTCPRGCGRWPWSSGALRRRAGLLRADLPTDRALAALAVAELRERRLPVRVAVAPARQGRLAPRRGRPGGRRRGRQRIGRLARGLVARAGAPAAQRGQALLMVLGAAFAILFAAALLAALGGALTRNGSSAAGGRPGRALRSTLAARRLPATVHDAAASGRGAESPPSGPARVPGTGGDGGARGRDPERRRPRPAARLLPRCRLLRAAAGSRRGHCVGRSAGASGTASEIGRRSVAGARRNPGRGKRRGRGVPAIRRRPAACRPPPEAGGYSGPLVYRQGKPMRPDVALAFDRLARAAAGRGSGW